MMLNTGAFTVLVKHFLHNATQSTAEGITNVNLMAILEEISGIIKLNDHLGPGNVGTKLLGNPSDMH